MSHLSLLTSLKVLDPGPEVPLPRCQTSRPDIDLAFTGDLGEGGRGEWGEAPAGESGGVLAWISAIRFSMFRIERGVVLSSGNPGSSEGSAKSKAFITTRHGEVSSFLLVLLFPRPGNALKRWSVRRGARKGASRGREDVRGVGVVPSGAFERVPRFFRGGRTHEPSLIL